MSEKELKPCPFCGGEVDYIHTDHETLIFRTHQFSCKRCHANVFLEAEGHYKTATETEIEAIDTWNRRADNGK